MYNQGPTIGRINPSFSDPPGEQNQSQNPMGQPVLPPYQEQPNAGYYGPGSYPNPSGYPSQPYGVPSGPQGPYVQQQPYPGMPAYPQRLFVGHTGVTVQPTVFMTSTPAAVHIPDYLCYSIFTMLFCCFPLGIAAIVTSVSTRDNNMAGRQDSAMRSSRTALVLNNVALSIGLTVYTLTTIFVLYVYYGIF